MSHAWLIRFGAICGVLLGLSLGIPGFIEGFTGETTATSFFIGLGAALGPPALTAVYLYGAAPGGFGAFSYAVNVIGLGLYSGVAFTLNLVFFFMEGPDIQAVMAGPTRLAVLGTAVVFVIGTVLFAIAMFRSRAVPLVPALGYGIALPLLALLARLPDGLLTTVVHVTAGGALVWLELAVLRRPRATASPSLASPSRTLA